MAKKYEYVFFFFFFFLLVTGSINCFLICNNYNTYWIFYTSRYTISFLFSGELASGDQVEEEVEVEEEMYQVKFLLVESGSCPVSRSNSKHVFLLRLVTSISTSDHVLGPKIEVPLRHAALSCVASGKLFIDIHWLRICIVL